MNVEVKQSAEQKLEAARDARLRTGQLDRRVDPDLVDGVDLNDFVERAFSRPFGDVIMDEV